MKRFRAFVAVCVAAAFCISLCIAALSAAVYFTCRDESPFSTPAIRKAVFADVLSGEDPALVAQLEQIPAFVAAQDRYVQQLVAWRYEDGQPWDELQQEEARTIAHALLEQTLDASYSQHTDYEATLESLSLPLQSALQAVFPPFDLVMHGAVRLQLNFAASIIRASAAAGGTIAAIVCLGFFILLCSEPRRRLLIMSLVFVTDAILCALLSVSFFVNGLLLQLHTPLQLLRDVPHDGQFALCIAAGFFLLLTLIFALCLRKMNQGTIAPAAEPAQIPVQEDFEAELTQIFEEAQVEEAKAATEEAQEPVQETLEDPTDDPVEVETSPVVPQPIFTGASQYDLDQEISADADMDALLAQAAGPLFAEVEPAQETAFLDDLSNLFEGRVDNGSRA